MNEIPLSLFNVMSVITFILILFTLIYKENFVRITTAFISMILSYVLSFIIINGNVVIIQSTGTAYTYIPIINTTLNYFWLFIAIVMGLFTVLFIIDEVNINLMAELEEANAED
jgi:hypothetical protein